MQAQYSRLPPVWKLFVIAVLSVLAPYAPGESAPPPGRFVHIGLCHVGLDHIPPSVHTLHQALIEKGYEDGKSMYFDWRNQPSAASSEEAMAEWVAGGVDVIVVFEGQCARAAKAATSEIPVIFVHVFDPVATGYIKSLARPGANMTGPVSNLNLIGKRLELLKQIKPDLKRVLVLYDAADPSSLRELDRVRRAAAALELELVERDTPDATALEQIFDDIDTLDVGGLILASFDLMTNHTHLIIDLADLAHIPLAAHRRQWVEWGALFAYAPDFASVGPIAARYIDKVVNGADPALLPVEEMSEIVLTVSTKRARKLGLEIPASVGSQRVTARS